MNTTVQLLLQIIPLERVTFRDAVRALANECGFVAISNPRFSIVASNPKHSISFSGAFVTTDGHTQIDNPLDSVSRFFDEARRMTVDPYLPFSGGCIGYIGFEGAKIILGYEPAKGFSRFPQCKFGLYKTVYVFDQVEKKSYMVTHGDGVDDLGLFDGRGVLQYAPTKKTDNLSVGDTRLSPTNERFKVILDDANTWLRSEKLEQIHIVQHITKTMSSIDPVDDFLGRDLSEGSHAIFSHEGAYSIVSSAQANQHKIIGRTPSFSLLKGVARRFAVGEPVGNALKFIDVHEEVHRGFHGGMFGFIDSNKKHFETIQKYVAHVDGSVTTSAGTSVEL